MAGTETKGQLTLQLNCTDTVRKKATAGAVKFNALVKFSTAAASQCNV